MKKNYIKPEMKVHVMEPLQLLAESGTGVESRVSYYGDECPDDGNEDIW